MKKKIKLETLVYVINRRFPTERGHGYQIAAMVEAFGAIGVKTEAWVSRRRQTVALLNTSPDKLYDLRHPLAVHWVDSFDPTDRSPQFVTQWWSHLDFIRRVYPRLRHKTPTAIYTRDEAVAGILGFLGWPIFFECHYEPERGSRLFWWFVSQTRGLIVNTQSLEHRIRQRLPELPLLYQPNGVAQYWLEQKPTQQLRRKLSLFKANRLVVYAGNLYSWKGVATLVAALEFLPTTYHLAIIGGTNRECQKLITQVVPSRRKRVHWLGHQPRAKLRTYLASADVLVLPATAIQSHASQYTAPLKLMEYLALGIPVVASDIMSHRNLASPAQLTFFEPDKPQALAQAIVQSQTSSGRVKIKFGKRLAATHTWDQRAETIRQFIEDQL